MVTGHGALKKIMTALTSFADDTLTIAELCATLARLCVRNEYCKEIVDLGGLKFVLVTLENHQKSKAVAQSCCTVLRALAGNDDVSPIWNCGEQKRKLSETQRHGHPFPHR